jgi:hypothetical protein
MPKLNEAVSRIEAFRPLVVIKNREIDLGRTHHTGPI